MASLSLRHPRTTIAVLLAVLTTLAGIVALPRAADAATAPKAKVPAPRAGIPAAIEPQSIEYVAQAACDPAFKPGTQKLGALLSATYPGITVQGTYGCGTDGSVSEHYEGRAIDWMTSLRNKQQATDAGAMINWLLATDKTGHKFAMARRMGIMYIIWNNRIWGGWDGTWQPYNNCASTPGLSSDNACHRTHVHLSLTWNGAMGRTSYWGSAVAATDYGPCRAKDLNWAGLYSGYNPTPCPDYPTAKAPGRASTTLSQLYRYSGAVLRQGSNGPAVSAVQSAVGAASTGVYNPATQAKVTAWQRSHALPATGVVAAPTWRSLLSAHKAPAPILCSGPSSLAAPGVLASGQVLCSPDRHTMLAMQTDGNLVAYRSDALTWSTRTAGKARGARLAVQGDGNLVVYGVDGRAVWSSRTYRDHRAGTLAVQNDGNVVLYNPTARWWIGTR